MKIQYISDLHLEFYEDILQIPIIPSADILCLLGDICNPDNKNYDIILEWTSKNFKKVFIIAGNHEYYSKFSFDDVNNIINDKVSKYTNITFLNNKIEEYKEYVFIGCTLWSQISNIKNYELKAYNDFKKIKGMNRQKYTSLHEKDLEFLKDVIPKYKNIICLTHHLPSLELIHEDYKNYPNFMFATSLNYLINKENIIAWLCGHSHKSNTKNINGVLCSLNPFGYPNENNEGYIKNTISKTITV